MSPIGRITSVESEEAIVMRERRDNARRDVAIVGLQNEHGEVLMIETLRLPGRWQPVGGGVDPQDTTPRHAAVRETKEELDVDLQPEDLRLVVEAPYDFGEGTVWCFTAQLPSAVELHFNSREIRQYCWLPVSEALKLPAFPATTRFLRALS